MAIYDRYEARRLREHRAWTLMDVATSTGIDVRYLADFEAGYRWMPPDYAERLDRALGARTPAGATPPAPLITAT